MLTTLSCVVFAIVGGLLAGVWTRGAHPAAVIVGMVVGAVFGLAPVEMIRVFFAAQMERPGWLRRIGMYIDALRAGEPIIWAGTILFLAFAAVMLAVWWKTARDLRREDEELKRRRGGR